MANFQMPASEFMTSPLETVDQSSFIDHAHRRLQQLGVSALPVVDTDRQVVGVISRTDVLRVGRHEAGARPDARLLAFPAKPVSDFMTPDPIAVEPDTPLAEIARLMRTNRIHRVFVRKGEGIDGIVTTRDLMRAIRAKRVNRPLSEFMSSPIYTIRASEPISMAAERLEKARVTGLVAVDGKWPVGVFTQTEALASRELPRDTAIEEVMNPAILVLDADTPLHRAAAQAASMDVRRIVVLKDGEASGIISGLDFASAML